jgi:hypothetical protein
MLVERVHEHLVAVTDVGDAPDHGIAFRREAAERIVTGPFGVEVRGECLGGELGREAQRGHTSHRHELGRLEIVALGQQVVGDAVVDVLERLVLSDSLRPVALGGGLALVELVEPVAARGVDGVLSQILARALAILPVTSVGPLGGRGAPSRRPSCGHHLEMERHENVPRLF